MIQSSDAINMARKSRNTRFLRPYVNLPEILNFKVIVQDYEAKLQRLKADKRKVEMEKETLKQKISVSVIRLTKGSVQ